MKEIQINKQETVVSKYVFKNNSLSPGLFKDVMSLNLPVSPNLGEAFYEKLSTLPTGIANQLEQWQGHNQGVITLPSLQRTIDYTKSEWGYVFTALINDLLDTDSLQQVIDLLEAENNAETQISLVDIYIGTGSFAVAQQKIDNLLASGSISQEWAGLRNILISLYSAGKTLRDMDSLQLQTVNDIAYSGEPLQEVANAQSILRLLFGTEFETTEILTATAGFRTKSNNSTIELPAKGNNIDLPSEIYLGDNIPNPFKGTTKIPYCLPDGYSGYINIFNADGILLEKYPVVATNSFIEFKKLTWNIGIYFYSIEVNGVELFHKKMILVK